MRLPSSILAVNSFAYSTSHRIKVSFVLSSLGFNEPISVDEDMCLQRKVDFFKQPSFNSNIRFSTSHRIKVSFALSSLGFNEAISVNESVMLKEMCLHHKVDPRQTTIIQLLWSNQPNIKYSTSHRICSLGFIIRR